MTEPLLRERLGSYLKTQERNTEAQLHPDFVCPTQLLGIQAELASFHWFQCSQGAARRMLGIRPLVDQSSFRLSELRARGFVTESTRHPIRPPVTGAVEHYFIAELLGPWQAKVSLCMHVPPQQWYVLDEHRLSR